MSPNAGIVEDHLVGRGQEQKSRNISKYQANSGNTVLIFGVGVEGGSGFSLCSSRPGTSHNHPVTLESMERGCDNMMMVGRKPRTAKDTGSTKCACWRGIPCPSIFTKRESTRHHLPNHGGHCRYLNRMSHRNRARDRWFWRKSVHRLLFSSIPAQVSISPFRTGPDVEGFKSERTSFPN